MTISEILNRQNSVKANIKRLEDEVEELGNDLMAEFERARQDFSSPEYWDDWSNYNAPIISNTDIKIPF